MLKQHATIYRRLMIIADVMIAGGSFFLAYFLRQSSFSARDLYPIDAYAWILPFIMALWGTLLYLSGIYNSFRLKSLGEVVWLVFKTALIGFLVFGSIIFLFKLTYVSRSFIVLMFTVCTFFLLLEKTILILIFRYFRGKGFNFRNILIVGTGPRAQKFISSVDQHRELGLKIIGLVDEELGGGPREVMGYPVMGCLKDIPRVIRLCAVDIVVFIVPRNWLDRIEESILYCETVGVSVSVAVDIFNLRFTAGKESHLFDFPLLTFERTPQKLGDLFLKRILDVFLAGTALILLSPVMAVLTILIKTTSPGPAFFKQRRCGLSGRWFDLYKFRTMDQDAETKLETLRQHNVMDGPVFKMENDPRITKVGKFLRKTSLDELPQLLNVLKGEMSLVGPRPPLPKEVKKYDDWQRRRLSMRPGITCIWQVSGRNQITDFNQWMRMDMDYIDRWSLQLDLMILLKTIPAVFSGKGAK
ncbi:MAG: sugar transferase [Candidatus Omnitrophica bacterium]|nr:sugar transferase [Candidatus Omnitrophota bacterium]